MSANVDTRRNMSAKVYRWADRDFWRQYYRMLKIHFKNEIDEKIIRIQGPMAAVFRTLTRENIISQIDPDAKVESSVLSEAKRIREQQSFDQFAAIAIQNPETNRRYLHDRMARNRGMAKEERELLFPPTVDEEQAHVENELLNDGELPEIDPRDDHQVHNRIHVKANQTPEARAHMRQHELLSIEVRNNPEIFPQEQAQQFQPPGGTPTNAPVAPEGAPAPAAAPASA